MRIDVLMLTLVVVGAVAGGATAQINDGDLIVTSGRASVDGIARRVDLTSGAWSTIAIYSPGRACKCRMHENNTEFLVALSMGAETIARTDPVTKTTRTFSALPGAPIGLDFDGNSQWFYAGLDTSVTPIQNIGIWTFGTGVPRSTFVKYPYVSGAYFSSISVDPDPTATGRYVAAFESWGSVAMLVADRTGAVSTLVPRSAIPRIWDMVVEPASGDYLVCAYSQGLLRATKDGKSITTITASIPAISAIVCAQDGTLWVASQAASGAVHHLTRRGKIKRTVPLVGGHLGIEIYGSRRLVCHGSGVPGSTVTVTVQSRRAGDGNKPYALACALTRRPASPKKCLKLGGNEFLLLNQEDPLVWATAGNAWPTIFQNFRGTTDKSGNAMAQVNIPKGFPKSSGVTIFVAGIIYDSRGVRTVTNTHWFILN